MLEALRRLLGHLRWADERTLEALAGAAAPPAAALEIYAHVLGTEHLYLSRLRQQPATVAVWPPLDLHACAGLSRENIAGFEAFLEPLRPDDLFRRIPYRNSAGQAFESTIEDMLLHVMLHGSYHRGQVAWILRQSGAEPNPTDYIAFVRGAPTATRATAIKTERRSGG